ncbi:MAG: ATP-dependent DNA helicase RecG [Eubacterium sp.]|nr:ATP-dependent DNA helicase RecG [Eubacterium sp.]
MIDDSIRTLKGIGEKTEKLFAKVGVTTCRQLLMFYPREYDRMALPVTVSEVTEGVKTAVVARIVQSASVRTYGRNSITMLLLREGSYSLQLNWFHMPYLKSMLKPGMTFVFRGPVIRKNNRLIMEHPEIYTVDKYREAQGRILPVYSLTAGLTNNMVRKSMEQVLAEGLLLPDPLPEETRQQAGLCEINYAIHQIHFPESEQALREARNRLCFNEFFFFILGVAFSRKNKEERKNFWPMQAGWETEDVIASLPFHLTAAQLSVWTEMEQDLTSDKLMMRMVQGDVGSGKTILAFLCMVLTAGNGYQAALMAPTEVLAEQHFRSLKDLLESCRLLDKYQPVLLTGSLTAKQKRQAYEKIRNGSALMIVGTHALIQEAVEYSKLALVITDEQHRFGVNQRMALAGGERAPHLLVMSATPIPRTLAMILYGDLDISVMKDKPKRRLPIKNAVVNTSYEKAAFDFIRDQVNAGHQAYVICPMVEPNEDVPCENVKEYSKKLKDVFEPDIKVAMLHGKMKGREKQDVMHRFAEGEIQVLVSTTVVEVGVDVPNATVMLIVNAERFGLAQLHQLRGRVGRGSAQSYCMFMQGDGREEIRKRLQILKESNDGFYIAEEDLKLRGPGDLLGVRQSGEALFEIADIYRDAEILKRAKDACESLLQLDPDLSLPQNVLLKKALAAYLSRQNDDSGQ